MNNITTRDESGRSVVPQLREVLLALVVALFVLPHAVSAADPPEANQVLFVSNGHHQEEADIYEHLLDVGAYEVTVMKASKIKGWTDLGLYDLIIITEFSHNIAWKGLDNIESSGKPVLIVEDGNFKYAYDFGLVNSDDCGEVSTDTIEAVEARYDAFTSRIGSEALVYQPYGTACGVAVQEVVPEVTPVFFGAHVFEEVVILVDYRRKIAATGVSDTARFTTDGWKLLDLLIEQILPRRPRRASASDVVQAYVDSGLPGFFNQVERDLRQDPSSWNYEEVELEAWLRRIEWDFDEVWSYVIEDIADLFGIPAMHPIAEFTYSHPERPHGPYPGFLPDVEPYSQEHEHWFLGQYWDPVTSNVVYTPWHWDQYHAGTDLGLGVNVEFFGRQVFYMGDTWDVDQPKWSRNECGRTGIFFDPDVRCDDMIAVSFDPGPQNGVDVSPAFEYDESSEEAAWIPLVVPGVHREFNPTLHNPPSTKYWISEDIEPPFSVPTGAVATRVPFEVFIADIPVTIYMPGVLLWYGTAVHPSAFSGDVGFDDADPSLRPTSWVGWSFDGLRFYSAYDGSSGGPIPFSVDGSPSGCFAPGQPCASDGDPARFVMVAAVDLSRSDHLELCAEYSESPLCLDEVYDPTSWPTQGGGGLLLYGSGRPYRKSGLFIAFIEREDIGAVDSSDRPVVHYWAGSELEWSYDEADSAPLTHASEEPPCDGYNEPNWDTDTEYFGCWPANGPWESTGVFGEISAQLIRSNDPDYSSEIVLLSNNDWNEWVYFWRAPLYEPWSGMIEAVDPGETLTKGYGPYIIDAYSDDEYPGTGPDGDVVLWHTISVWDGTVFRPYGVYTGEETIQWLPQPW
jgi:hypothetical protein